MPSCEKQGLSFTRAMWVNSTGPLVAIIDDEDSVGRALQRLMRSAGLEVETFTSGIEFAQSLQRRRPDCVVLDLHMPQMSGLAVLALLTHSTSPPIPVVAITGHDTPETQRRALDGGASAYLRKPVDGQALLDAVAQAMVKAGDSTSNHRSGT